MSETVLVRLVPPTFPVGACPLTIQAEWDLGVALMQAQLTVNGATSFFNYGSAVPDQNRRGFPWIRTTHDAFDDVYFFHLGYWLTVYKSAPAGPNGVRWGYADDEASLLTFEGGENAPATLVAGPFWEIDHDFDGRSPMGPGTILGANPAKDLSVDENYGSGAQLQSAQQVPPHTHSLNTEASITNADGSIKVVNSGAGGPGLQIGLTGLATTALSVLANAFTGTQETSPVIHPVRGLYQIRRTIRMYRRLGP